MLKSLVQKTKNLFRFAARSSKKILPSEQAKDTANEKLQEYLKSRHKGQLLKIACEAEVRRRGLRGLEKKIFRKNFREAFRVVRDDKGNPVLALRPKVAKA